MLLYTIIHISGEYAVMCVFQVLTSSHLIVIPIWEGTFVILYRLLLSRGFKLIYILKKRTNVYCRRGITEQERWPEVYNIIHISQQSHISDKKEIDISPPVA